MKTRYILLLVLCACLCASCQSPAAAPLDPDIEEYAVYNALLDSKFSASGISQILFVDQTDTSSDALTERDLAAFQQSAPLDDDLITNFMARNEESHPLEPTLEFGSDYQLLSQEEIDELRPLDEASGWTLFYEKYPNAFGFVYLSRVGFNADFSQALVFISTYHYDRLLEGEYYLMVRQDGRWVIEANYGFQS